MLAYGFSNDSGLLESRKFLSVKHGMGLFRSKIYFQFFCRLTHAMTLLMQTLLLLVLIKLLPLILQL